MVAESAQIGEVIALCIKVENLRRISNVSKLTKRIKDNLLIYTRRQIKKIKVSEREKAVFDNKLLPTFFRPNVISGHKIQYTAPVGVSLQQYIKNDMTIYKLYNVLARIIEATKLIDESKLYLQNLVLDMKTITVKELTGEIFFIYEPLVNRTSSTNIYGFIADFIWECEGKNQETDKEIKKIQDFLDEDGKCSIDEIENFILKNYPQIYHHIVRLEKSQSNFLTSDKLSYQKHFEGNVPEVVSEETTILREQSDIETTILFADNMEEGTVLLCESSGYLIRLKNQEKIRISGTIFSLGKECGMNYQISDNKAISRRHALLRKESENFYIMDCNTTNKTYLNSECLTPEQWYSLNDGDRVKLADEEFYFNIEF